jgi:hypothetical protein
MHERVLYHGTAQTDIFHPKHDDTIGVRHPLNPSDSANLTDNFDYATLCAIGAVATHMSPNPIVVTYRLPNSILIDEGEIRGNPGKRGFSTTIDVLPNDLPINFLVQNGYDYAFLREEYQKGFRYFRVPSRYVIKIERPPLPEETEQAIRKFLSLGL